MKKDFGGKASLEFIRFAPGELEESGVATEKAESVTW